MIGVAGDQRFVGAEEGDGAVGGDAVVGHRRRPGGRGREGANGQRDGGEEAAPGESQGQARREDVEGWIVIDSGLSAEGTPLFSRDALGWPEKREGAGLSARPRRNFTPGLTPPKRYG